MGKFKAGDIIIGNELNDYAITCQGRRAIVVETRGDNGERLYIRNYPDDSAQINGWMRWRDSEKWFVDEEKFDLWVPIEVSLIDMLEKGECEWTNSEAVTV